MKAKIIIIPKQAVVDQQGKTVENALTQMGFAELGAVHLGKRVEIESLERLLVIVQEGQEDEVKRILEKWDLPWAEVGRVTDASRMVVCNQGQIVPDIPAKPADEAAVYQREALEPAYLKDVRAFTLTGIPDTKDPAQDLKALLSWPTVTSKNWVYRQYDDTSRNGTAVAPGSDTAMLRIKSDSLPVSAEAVGVEPAATAVAEKFIVVTVECNATYTYLDAYEAGKIAVAEAARNLACTGAIPLGTTDNLNFGNPHDPEVFWQVRESVRGLAEGCRAFNAQVTGGYISLYSQSPSPPIGPTPTVAMVGLVENPQHITTQWFKDAGDAIILLGSILETSDSLLGLGGSAYLQRVHGLKTGTPPKCDLEKEKELHLALRALIHSGVIKSAHYCSEGGLAVTLAESCISQQIARETPKLVGARIDLSSLLPKNPDQSPVSSHNPDTTRLDALLFGESQGRIVISVRALDAGKVLAQAKILEVPATRIGTVGGEAIEIKAAEATLSCPVTELHDLWWNSIARAMG